MAILVGMSASAAFAGAPFVTDDPLPPDKGHGEIDVFVTGNKAQGNYEGAAGLDIAYGLVDDIQLTVALPMDTGRDTGEPIARGDLEAGIKYRFIHDETAGFDVAIFPRAILPTAAGDGGRRVRFLLPVWAQKDFGKWSLFGGGGYTINPGAGNRDYWTQSIAITRDVSDKLTIGGEVTHQGPDEVGVSSSTALNFGGIYKLGGPFALLFSAGPTLAIDGNDGGFNGYAALAISF